jgi:hypothetical protein
VPTSTEQNTAAPAGIDMATATTQLVPATVSGTLEDAFIFAVGNATNSGNGTWSLQDGTGKVIAQGGISVSSGQKVNVTLFQLTGGAVRFTNGLKLICTETAALGVTINCNLYYRIP